MTREELLKAVLEVLENTPGSTAKEIRKKIGQGIHKKEVNSVLYGAAKTGEVRKEDTGKAPRWHVAA